MPQVKPQSDLAGRISGLLTFFGGIALLILVFSSAWDLFHTPVLATAPGAKADPTAMGLGTAVVGAIVRLLILGLLTVVASLVTSKGIHMYFAANGWTDGASHPPRVREREEPAHAPQAPTVPGKQSLSQ